jgi:NADPH2:quinone reductase
VKAWRVHTLGEPQDVLRLDDVADPTPGPDRAVVAVDAVALNFPDVLLCRGEYQVKPELPFTPGVEVAGTILDPGGTGREAGTRVLLAPGLPHGGLAERVTGAATAMLALPGDIPAAHAAALLVTYQTGWVGLHRRAGLRPGETLLVHAGAGGVGSAAIQLGLAAGARVIATAGGPDKVRVCRELGAELAIDYQAEDFVAAVKEATAGRGADVVFDPVGGDVFTRSTKCIAFEGRLLVVGFAGGTIPAVPAGHALVKNYSVVGLHWGLYGLLEPELIPRVHEEILRLYRDGAIRPLVEEAAFADAPAQLHRLASRATVGKVVLTPPIPADPQ